MPIFRILGGRSSSSSSSDNSGSQQQQPANRQSYCRYTYPGQRVSRPPPTNPALSSSAPPAQCPIPSNTAAGAVSQSLPVGCNGNDNLILRGSHVPSAPPSSSAAAATAPTGTTSTSRTSTTSATASASDGTKPGAYQVSRTTSGPSQVYRVTVPSGVRPGKEFTVHAGPRRVRVRCPPTSHPGQSLQITLPPEPVTHYLPLKMAPLTAATLPSSSGGSVGEADGGAVPMTPDVQKVNEQAAKTGGTAQTFLVTIPPNIYPGMQFTVHVGDKRFMVTCPATAGPNMKVRIVPPTVPEEPDATPKTQVFEVAVPTGVSPGQPFALMANGMRVLVTCPPKVVPGQKIRFQLPVSQMVGSIKLSYESEKAGWTRTIRATDLKFQWVRLDGGDGSTDQASSSANIHKDEVEKVDIEGMGRFDFKRSAYVRKISFLEGNDARMRTGKVELVPANEAVVDSRLVVKNKTLLSYADIAMVQGKALEEKTAWFQNICTTLTSAWEDGHIKMVVRRRHLLLDSVDAIMSLGRDDLRKRWRIEFLGEPGIDAGGVTREWFQLVTKQIFDPDFGLWLSSVNNQMCVNINPASGK